MNSKRKLIIIIVVFALLMAGAFALYNVLGKDMAPGISAENGGDKEEAGREEAGEEERVKAPDFTAYDSEGKEVSLSDYLGKPVILNFWASWCGPCKMEMPDFNKAYLERGDEIHFLMVNMTDGDRETVETAKEYIESEGFSFPIIYDKDSEAAMTYGAHSIPMTFFIDEEGYLIARANGALDKASLQTGIDMITQ